jgi:hypothetical protein
MWPINAIEAQRCCAETVVDNNRPRTKIERIELLQSSYQGATGPSRTGYGAGKGGGPGPVLRMRRGMQSPAAHHVRMGEASPNP